MERIGPSQRDIKLRPCYVHTSLFKNQVHPVRASKLDGSVPWLVHCTLLTGGAGDAIGSPFRDRWRYDRSGVHQ